MCNCEVGSQVASRCECTLAIIEPNWRGLRRPTDVIPDECLVHTHSRVMRRRHVCSVGCDKLEKPDVSQQVSSV